LGKARLISIVDDDLSVREATAGLLEAHGFATAAFASAEEFLGSASIGDTACLLADVRMLGLSGVELQRRLVDAGHRIPTILMTAYPEEHVRLAAMQGGALEVLSKPLSEERLISCLRAALPGRAAGAGD
jgi:FixJ family two-component response regulator